MGSTVNELTGANRKARRAASRAARAQEAAAGQLRADVMDIAKLSPQQIAQEEQVLQKQNASLQRQERLIASIDPAILEASQQALKLLKGEESSALAPLRNRRQRQRQQLLDTLRQQLGPGAETSSAGQQALQKFDAETADVMAGRQQATLGSLFGMASQGAGLRQGLQGGIGLLAGMSQASQNRNLDQARLLSGVGQGQVQTAGSRFTGDLIRAQQLQGLGMDFSRAAGQAVGAFATASGGGMGNVVGESGSLSGAFGRMFGTGGPMEEQV